MEIEESEYLLGFRWQRFTYEIQEKNAFVFLFVKQKILILDLIVPVSRTMRSFMMKIWNFFGIIWLILDLFPDRKGLSKKFFCISNLLNKNYFKKSLKKYPFPKKSFDFFIFRCFNLKINLKKFVQKFTLYSFTQKFINFSLFLGF